MNQSTQSYWLATSSHLTRYPTLEGTVSVDVVIVGGGITGLSVALKLKQAGKSVAVVEQNQIAHGDSGQTTAHLTEVIDSKYQTLASHFGTVGAKAAATSGREALHQIEIWAREYNIPCQFKRIPAYLYTQDENQVSSLQDECALAQSFGVHAYWEESVPLQFETCGGIRFSHQSQFNPLPYLQTLAQQIHGGGSYVFENSRVIETEDGSPCRIRTARGSITSKNLVIATYSPITNQTLMPTKVAAYRTYAISAELKTPPTEEALFWDTAEPYHYIRPQDGIWIIGGEDHKTGQNEHTEENPKNLEKFTSKYFGLSRVLHRWSGQILEPVDGLPYIGLAPGMRRTYLATGFTGNGMTFGTLSGMIISDLIVKKKNKYEELYSPSRVKPLASMKEFISENKDYPICMIKDRLKSADVDSFAKIKKGQGKTIYFEGKKLAVFRNETGELETVSAVCPHMGCHVHFNRSEKSWDCPCHGSRFDTRGQVLNGPAMENLKPVQVPQSAKSPTKTPDKDQVA